MTDVLGFVGMFVLALAGLLWMARRQPKRNMAPWQALADRLGARCPAEGQVDGQLDVPLAALHPVLQTVLQGAGPRAPFGGAQGAGPEVLEVAARMKASVGGPMVWAFAFEDGHSVEEPTPPSLRLTVRGSALRLPDLHLRPRRASAAPGGMVDLQALDDRWAVQSQEPRRVHRLMDADTAHALRALCEPGAALGPDAVLHIDMGMGRLDVHASVVTSPCAPEQAEALVRWALGLIERSIDALKADPSLGWGLH